MELRPYQKKAIQAANEHWGEWNKELLVLPTGTGKTIIFNQIARDRSRDGRVLILAHRDELIEQARDKYEGITGKIKAQENDIKPITVGSVQTMCRRKYDPSMFQTVIVDEAHHAISDSYQTVLQQFPDAKVLGVTATPDRGDKQSLAKYFEGIAYEYRLRQAVEDGYLVRPTARCIPLEIDMSTVKVRVGDFEVNSIAEALEPYLPEIAKQIALYASDRKTVVFCPLISIAKEFCEYLNEAGIEAREVNGESPDRKETLKWFDEAGKGTALCNAMLLTEGWDCPSADCIVVLRPTKIRSLYTQMVGRILRLAPNKKDALILDFLWLTQKHDLCRPASLVSENSKDCEHIKKSSEDTEIDLFDAETDAVEARRNALAEALAAQKRKKAKLVDPLQWFVSTGEMALEDYQPFARWEYEPVTEKQRTILESFGINPDGIDTKGKASLMIDRAIARRQQGLATPKQIRCLERYGYERVGEWSFEAANKKIGLLAANGWKRNWRTG